MHVFGQWEESRVHRGKPHMQVENIQTAHKKKQRPQARFELVTTSANYHKTVQPHEYDDDKVCSICSFSYVALPTPTSSTLFSLFDRYISVYHL